MSIKVKRYEDGRILITPIMMYVENRPNWLVRLYCRIVKHWWAEHENSDIKEYCVRCNLVKPKSPALVCSSLNEFKVRY